MRIELLYFGGCPTYRNAAEDVRRVLAETSVEAELELVEVNSDEEARRLGFPGSPTLRIDGRDPFPVPERGEGGLTCRVYATPEGMKGTPTAAMIREALGSGKEPPERKPLTPRDEEPVELGGVFGVPFRTLLVREIRRFVLVWTQRPCLRPSSPPRSTSWSSATGWEAAFGRLRGSPIWSSSSQGWS